MESENPEISKRPWLQLSRYFSLNHKCQPYGSARGKVVGIHHLMAVNSWQSIHSLSIYFSLHLSGQQQTNPPSPFAERGQEILGSVDAEVLLSKVCQPLNLGTLNTVNIRKVFKMAVTVSAPSLKHSTVEMQSRFRRAVFSFGSHPLFGNIY